jgi:hypothetical protein
MIADERMLSPARLVEGGRRPSSLTRRPRKGSEEWQTWCKARDACFECGDQGHIVCDCSQESGTSFKERRDNHSGLLNVVVSIHLYPTSHSPLLAARPGT